MFLRTSVLKIIQGIQGVDKDTLNRKIHFLSSDLFVSSLIYLY